MEKIININMSGQVIAIEDSAYSSLKAYVESLYNLFANEEGCDEIINDIESRIAELMSDKIKHGSVAITEADIQEIITSMGRVEDFAANEDEPQLGPQSPNSRRAGQRPKGDRRFRRDSNDKVLGGVCSGLASYLNVDPALVRIVFAILTLGGWGLGLLLYIGLWILVPASPLEVYRGRRLFRSEEDKWLGGVCSGLAAYFGKDTWVFRLVFAAPVLLSTFSGSFNIIGTTFIFGSFTGAFILIYIVLWMVLPLATSEFEKMEMRGEKVDLNSIRENVYAGMGDIKNRAKDWSGEVKESATRLSGEASNFMATRGRDFAREAQAAAKPLAARGGHILATIFKTFFLFIATTIAFALFVMLIAYVFTGMAEFTNDFIFQTGTQKALSWIVVILVLGVPLVAIITYIVRRAIKVKTHNRYLGRTFAALWFTGLICLLWLAGSLANDFRKYERVSNEVPIIQPDSGKLILKVPGRGISYSNTEPWLTGQIEGWDVAGDSMLTAHVQIRADVSPDSQYHVSILRYAAGSTSREAFDRAQQIEYSAKSESDSVVLLDNGYAIRNTQKYRRQNVVVEVLVPAGRKLRIDRSVADKLTGAGFVVSEDAVRRNKDWSVQWDDVYDEWETDIDYTMTVDGELVDPLHPPVDKKEQARKKIEEMNRIDSLNMQMEALKQQRDSLERARQ